jgi:bacterioferritin-associated ferredoxin
MVVCICHRVSDRDIARHAAQGASFEEIQMDLGVASQCGRCEPCAREVVAQCRAELPLCFVRDASIPAPVTTQTTSSSNRSARFWSHG